MWIYCSIWNKLLFIIINGILLLNKYKPASVGEFLVTHQREFDKSLARENKFFFFFFRFEDSNWTSPKYNHTISPLSFSPLIWTKHIINPTLSHFILFGNPWFGTIHADNDIKWFRIHYIHTRYYWTTVMIWKTKKEGILVLLLSIVQYRCITQRFFFQGVKPLEERKEKPFITKAVAFTLFLHFY